MTLWSAILFIGMTMLHTASPSAVVHPLGYDDDLWICPHTGIAVPKQYDEHLAWRDEVRKAAAASRQLQRDWLEACRISPLLWINAWVWTYRPHMTCEDGVERNAGAVWIDEQGAIHAVPPADHPMITWPAQDDAVERQIEGFDQGGLFLWDKSREQGATVLIMDTLTHALLFRERFSALVISKKADLVDSTEEDSLLSKVDYILGYLPLWMADPNHLRRTHKPPYIGYTPTRSRLLGETSNEDVGQSLRTQVLVVDEAARYPFQRSLLKSIETVAGCTVLASTPDGPGTTFSKLRINYERSPAARKRMSILTLGYWDHPLKGRGRKWTIDLTGEVTGKAGSGYFETPAFEIARATAASPRDWRENWLIDHETSGMLVIDAGAIARLRRGVRPGRRGLLVRNDHGRLVFVESEHGQLVIWCELYDGEPSLATNYVQAWDFGFGVESAISSGGIMDRSTGVVIAEYTDAITAPHDLAPVAEDMGEWAGGQHGQAFLIFERNSPGMGFGAELVKRGNYVHLYHQRQIDTDAEERTSKWGWWSDETRREVLFSQLSKSMRQGAFTTYSEAGLDDCAQWIINEHGKIVAGSRRDLPSGAQARHGDFAITYGLLELGRAEAPLYDPPEPRYRAGTYGHAAGHDEEP